MPIMNESISNMILNDKHYKISLQKFNKYVKNVCEIAEINELKEGGIVKVDENKVKRKVNGLYPKWQLITAHAFRRSFATNYYKTISTPILMQITGHTKESTFLKYINKQVDRDDNA